MSTDEVVRATPDQASSADTLEDAVSAVRLGIWASAARCVLTYVIAPAAGTAGVFLGPTGTILQILGAVTGISGARRLWALQHRGRYAYAAVAIAVTVAALASALQLIGRAVS